jgi:hypothetical protein
MVHTSSIKQLPYDFALKGVDSSSLLPAHRALLVISCNYFKDYFMRPNKGEEVQDVVTIQQFTYSDLKIFLNFLYNNVLPAIDTVDDYLRVKNILLFFDVTIYDYLGMLTKNPIPIDTAERLLQIGEINKRQYDLYYERYYRL